jgi:hypothetical protein
MQQETPAERRSTQGECWITVEERSGNAHQKVTPRLCTSGAFPCAPAFSAGVFAAFPTAWIRLIPTVLNWHEQAAGGTTGGNFAGDTAIPGIPGTTGSGDYFVMEATGFMQLPAGTHRLGVNSDDGFKLTFGTGINPLDKFTPLQVAILDGTRGFANTEVNVTVSTAGIYPFRLIWWENTGANSGVEFFNFAPGTTSGTRYLVNDAAQANAFKTYRELVTPISTPIATFVSPAAGSTTSGPRPFIEVDLQNQTTSVNTTTIQLSLDGSDLVPNVTEADGKVRISALAPLVNASSAHTARLIYSDSAGTSITNSWAFTTAAYTTIPASFAVASVDATKPGFKARVYQYDNVPADLSQNLARGPGGTGLVPNAERQLARGYNDPATGQPYPNTAAPQWTHADPGAPIDDLDANGYFIVPGVVNWVENAGGAATGGNFTSASVPPMPDDNMPGLPGTASNANDRTVYSIETILELKAGAYRFGVNSDDGFRLSFGQGPGDVIGIQLATAGDRGFTDTTVDFRVAADGLYPVRLMYFESTGGTGVEFFAVDLVTGVKTLINDTSSDAGLKAYRESAASRPYISRVLPAVGDQFVHADRDLEVDIQDGAIPVDASSIELRLNGTVVPVTPSKAGSLTRIRRAGSVTSLLGSGNNNVSVIYSYTAGGTTTLITNNWSFKRPDLYRHGAGGQPRTGILGFQSRLQCPRSPDGPLARRQPGQRRTLHRQRRRRQQHAAPRDPAFRGLHQPDQWYAVLQSRHARLQPRRLLRGPRRHQLEQCERQRRLRSRQQRHLQRRRQSC